MQAGGVMTSLRYHVIQKVQVQLKNGRSRTCSNLIRSDSSGFNISSMASSAFADRCRSYFRVRMHFGMFSFSNGIAPVNKMYNKHPSCQTQSDFE